MVVTALGLPETSYSPEDLEVCEIRPNNMLSDIRRMLNLNNSGGDFEALPIPNRSIGVIVDGVGSISGRPVNRFFSSLLQFTVYGDVLIMKHDEDGEAIDLVTKEQTLQYWRENNCEKLVQLINTSSE